MKKYFVFILVCFLMGGMSVQAGVKFGLKAGVNLSSINFDKDQLVNNLDTKNFTGLQVGPMIEFITPLGLGLDLSVLYSQQGFKLPTADSKWEDFKMNTLQIPLNLKFKTELPLVSKLLALYGALGPYASLGLDKDLKEQVETKSFGFGLNFGIGAEVLSHLQIGVNYQLGLSDDYSNFKFETPTLKDLKGLKGKPATWSITATYLF